MSVLSSSCLAPDLLGITRSEPPGPRLRNHEQGCCRVGFDRHRRARHAERSVTREWRKACADSPGQISQAVRTEHKNLATSTFRRLLSSDSAFADDSTSEDASPVSVAPRRTSLMLEDI